jgi:ureidoacrylate peracid hydrolase
MGSLEKQVVVDARPDRLSLDLSTAAVVVVDMQNDFGSEGGMFALAGIDISGIKGVVPPTARVLGAARRAGLPVVYLKMGFHSDLSNAGGPDAPNLLRHRRMRVGDETTAPDGSPSRILIRDTWNTDIIPELTPEPGDSVVWKHRYSGFFETELDSVLRTHSVKTLIVTGCTTSICVESTIRDAFFRDYRCLLLEDCAAEPIGADLPRGNHEASLLSIQLLFGWIARSTDFIAAVEGRRVASPA